jgi:hypothetical protein
MRKSEEDSSIISFRNCERTFVDEDIKVPSYEIGSGLA